MWVTEELTPFTVMHHGVREVLDVRKTQFQMMCVAEIGPYGRALILDGRLQTTVGDEFLYHEPLIHIPCLLSGEAPKKVR